MLFSLAAAAGGCGFTGEPVFAGRRVADVAPWEDVGPLTICDGSRRLAPLNAGAAGLCGPGGASGAGASCAADGECRSRERCVCGRCSVAVCDSADECGAPFTCSFGDRRCDRACAGDADCARGESCVPGKHVCRGGCSTSADCQTGESCQSSTGACIATACTDDASCFGGRRCIAQRAPSALAEPSPLAENSTIVLFFERTDPGGTPAIWRATSRDGVSFAIDPPRALTDGRAPSVVHAGARWLLAYADAGGLAVQSSTDGVTFGGRRSVGPGDQPSLLQLADGSFALYFADAAGNLARVTSSDAQSFGAPAIVLEPPALADPVLWRGVDRIASPFAEALRSADGQPFVRLWFAAHGTESAASLEFGQTVATPPDFSVGEAASLDGTSFVPYPFNPVFSRVVDFLTHPSELDPAVLSAGDEWRLYYRRAAADGTQSENLAVARSPQQAQ